MNRISNRPDIWPTNIRPRCMTKHPPKAGYWFLYPPRYRISGKISDIPKKLIFLQNIWPDTGYLAKYPLRYRTSSKIFGQIPDIWQNIWPDTGYLADYPPRYKISGKNIWPDNGYRTKTWPDTWYTFVRMSDQMLNWPWYQISGQAWYMVVSY